jgi:nucleoside-diphosphate-sugar epimerase
MKVVVSGGTQFIGPYVIRLLAEQGHEVTIVPRGETEAELPDAVQEVHPRGLPPVADRPV